MEEMNTRNNSGMEENCKEEAIRVVETEKLRRRN